jgi:hypothetical protein
VIELIERLIRIECERTARAAQSTGTEDTRSTS